MTLLQKTRYKAIVKETKNLFLEQGIDAVTMADIASNLSVGEATLYRYFGKKQTLMIDVATMLWQDIYGVLEKKPLQTTGYDNLKFFFNYFLEIFQNNPEFFRFIDEFDVKITQLEIASDELKNYEKAILKFKEMFDTFFKMGVLDKTVNKDIDKDIFYYTTNHALIGLCKKLSTKSHMLEYECQIQESKQIECLIQICLYYIH